MPLFYRFLLYSLAGSITLLNLLVLPGLIGVLTDSSSLTEAQAGWSASAGFLGSALIAMTLAFRMHHMDLRKLAIVSFLAGVLGDVVSAFVVSDPSLLIGSRFLSGLGTGAAYTAVVAAFARERHAERGYGLFITLQFIVSGAGLYILPVFSAHITAFGLYMAFATLNALGALLCVSLRGRGEESQRVEGAMRRSEWQVLASRATIFGVLAFAVYEAANVAQFTYSERFAVHIQLTDQQIGMAMLIGSLAGIPGAFTIVLTGSRFGYVWPIAIGVVISVSGLALLMVSHTYWPFFFAFCLLGFGWAFCLPYIQGLLARLDPAGSALAAGAAASTIGGSVGPALAAMLLGDAEYRRIFAVAAAGLILAAFAFMLTRTREVTNEPS